MILHKEMSCKIQFYFIYKHTMNMYPYKRITVSFWINVFFWVFHLVLPISVAAHDACRLLCRSATSKRDRLGVGLDRGSLFFTWEVTSWPWLCALPPVPPVKTNVTMENHWFQKEIDLQQKGSWASLDIQHLPNTRFFTSPPFHAPTVLFYFNHCGSVNRVFVVLRYTYPIGTTCISPTYHLPFLKLTVRPRK